MLSSEQGLLVKEDLLKKLYFRSGRRLGDDGLQWLKIHCINLTGILKKESVSTRRTFAEETMSKILDSANKPLSGDYISRPF